MKKIGLIISFMCFMLLLKSQINAQSVIVIPFTKEGQNKRKIIENDNCYKTFETMIKETFLKQEQFQLIDYLTILQKYKNDDLKMPSSANGVIEELIKFAHPDIYITADISNFREGKEHAIRINLTAHWTNTGKTIAATTLDSGRRYYDDCALLMAKLRQNKGMDDIPKIEAFIQMMKVMMPNDTGMNAAQPISILFTNESEDYHYLNKIKDKKLLFQEIKNWIKDNTEDKKADGDISKDLLRFNEVSIALYTEDGDKQSPIDYGAELLIFLTSLTFDDDEIDLEFDFNVIGNNINYILK